MRRLVTACFTFAGIFVSASAWSQGHPHNDGTIHVPRALYEIEATVNPDSGIVRARAGVTYRNNSHDTLSSIRFSVALDNNGALRLDSLLFAGVHLSEEDISLNDSVLTVTLPNQLAPYASGSFLVTFEARIPVDDDRAETTLWNRWYPEILPYRNGRWYVGEMNQVREFAHYDINLKTDSAWTAVFPGRLINDKEHFGIFPDLGDDRTIHDITRLHGRTPQGEPYNPVFDGGYKNYFIAANAVPGFPLILMREPIIDIGSSGQTQVRVFYPEELRPTWGKTVVKSTIEALAFYTGHIDHYPYDNLTIAAGQIDLCSSPPGPMVVLPETLEGSGNIRAALLTAVALRWFNPPLRTSEPVGERLRLGTAYYAALLARENAPAADRYRGFGLLEQTLHDCLETNAAADLVTRHLPTWFQYRRSQLGSDSVWNLLAARADLSDHSYPPFDTLGAVPGLMNMANLYNTFDIAITSAGCSDSLYSVDNRDSLLPALHFDLFNSTNDTLALEWATVFAGSDTLYDTLITNPGQENHVLLCLPCLSRPLTAIVLDPNHLLPDVERRNNIWRHRPKRSHYYPPADLFPPYRR